MSPYAADVNGARDYPNVRLDEAEAILDQIDGDWREHVSMVVAGDAELASAVIVQQRVGRSG